MKDIYIRTLAETESFAQRLVAKMEYPACICLSGDLGAGKTTFTKYIAKAMQIEDVVTSPTFTILKLYEGDVPLYHIDAYRLEGVTQDLGFEEYFESDGLVVIEWYTFIEDILPDERLEINIELKDEMRIFHVEAKGERYQRLLEAME